MIKVTKGNYTLTYQKVDNLVDSLNMIRENEDGTKSFFPIVPRSLTDPDHIPYTKLLNYTESDLSIILDREIDKLHK